MEKSLPAVACAPCVGPDSLKRAYRAPGKAGPASSKAPPLEMFHRIIALAFGPAPLFCKHYGHERRRPAGMKMFLGPFWHGDLRQSDTILPTPAACRTRPGGRMVCPALCPIGAPPPDTASHGRPDRFWCPHVKPKSGRPIFPKSGNSDKPLQPAPLHRRRGRRYFLPSHRFPWGPKTWPSLSPKKAG